MADTQSNDHQPRSPPLNNMLTSWLTGGAGSIVAPDENYKPKEPLPVNGLSSFWRLVAPPDKKLLQVAGLEDPPSGEEDLEAGGLPASPVDDRKSSVKFSPFLSPDASAAAPPPAGAFLSPSIRVDSVLCTHCKKMTPIKAASTPQSDIDDAFRTPHSTKGTPLNDGSANNDLVQAELKGKVLVTIEKYAKNLTSPPNVAEKRNQVFRLCGNSTLKPKVLQKLGGLLEKDISLHQERATGLGTTVPDAYTPLMAAAYSGNLDATKMILEQRPEGCDDVNIIGQAAIHIAAENGHVEVIKSLKAHHEQRGDNLDTLVDMSLRTALATAMTSTLGKAKKNRDLMKKELFSPISLRNNLSIIGSPQPTAMRQMVSRSLDIVYEHSDMPGMRTICSTEDAICTEEWRNHASKAFLLLGVCDGHGDQGKISHLVAKYIAASIKAQTMTLSQEPTNSDWAELWTTVCLEVDAQIKSTGKSGGSTGVFALVTSKEVVVANIGDSRGILVQSNPSESANANQGDTQDTPELVEEVEATPTTAAGESSGPDDNDNNSKGLSAVPVGEQAPEGGDITNLNGDAQAVAESVPKRLETLPMAEAQQDGFVVVAMSEDHKPSLDQEKVRIEQSGLEVVAESFEENGEEVTIHKVKKGAKLMAASRTFGDFEFKSNKDLGPAEQAVIAVPEVRIHARDPEKDVFLILACDGIWDVMSNQEVARFVVEQTAKGEKAKTDKNGRLAQIGDDLLRECLDRGSEDNMTVTIAALAKCTKSFSNHGNIQGKALFGSPVPETHNKTADI